ncbi:MAG: hypothetical protein ACQEW2_17055 [Bacillota bacterium]
MDKFLLKRKPEINAIALPVWLGTGLLVPLLELEPVLGPADDGNHPSPGSARSAASADKAGVIFVLAYAGYFLFLSFV